jgi:hypothetical protein
LEKRGSGHGGIAGVHINGCAMLRSCQQDFSESAILKATGACRIPDAAVLKIEQLVAAPIWEALPGSHPWAPSKVR